MSRRYQSQKGMRRVITRKATFFIHVGPTNIHSRADCPPHDSMCLECHGTTAQIVNRSLTDCFSIVSASCIKRRPFLLVSRSRLFTIGMLLLVPLAAIVPCFYLSYHPVRRIANIPQISWATPGFLPYQEDPSINPLVWRRSLALCISLKAL